MNVREAIVRSSQSRPPRFLHVSFNQDESCFSCATQDGFAIYNSEPLDCKLSKIFDGANTGIGYTRMLYRTNYIALVGGGKKPKYSINRLVIWDDLLKKESIVLKFMSPIRHVFLSRIYIIVVLENSLEVFHFKSSPSPTRVCPAMDIAPNGAADFVVGEGRGRRRESNGSSTSNNTIESASGIIAYASSRVTGQLHIADLSQIRRTPNESSANVLVPTTIVKAHKNPLRLVKLNRQGTMVATCSTQGTLIRVFSTQNGAFIKEFRRGSDKADIYQMAFSPQGTRLAVVSDKQTLHIFKISATSKDHQPEKYDDAFHNQIRILGNMVPQNWKPKYLGSIWSICSVPLKNPMARHNEIDLAFHNDRCALGWSDTPTTGQDYDDTLILVWQNSGIWEKYVILEKEPKIYNANETLNNHTEPASRQWELVRESWREL